MNYMHPSRDERIVAVAGRRKIAAHQLKPVLLALRNLFEELQPIALVASAAAGADLLALQEAKNFGVERYIVLPFASAEFREKSVTDLGEQWTASFDTLIGELDPEHCTVLRQDNLSGDAVYAATNALILDCATALARDGKPIAVRIWDGRSRGASDLTASFGEEAIRRGISVRDIILAN